MNRNRMLRLLALEGAACLALAITAGGEAAQLSLLTLPFALPGRGLRALSLLGSGWNVLAIALYAVLSLLPMLWFAHVRTSRAAAGEDWLLPLMSATLFGVLYAAVNPTWPAGTVLGDGEMSLLSFSVVFFAEWAAYVLLRVLRAAQCADAQGLRRLISRVLWLLAAVFVYSAFAAAPASLLASLRDLSAANHVDAPSSGVFGVDAPPLFWTQAVFVLRALVSMAADLLSLRVIFAAQALLAARDADDAQLAEDAASCLLRRSAQALRLTLLSTLGVDLLQLLLMRLLRSSSFTVSLPLGAMALCLGALLLTRLLQENRRLRQDNDLFI